MKAQDVIIKDLDHGMLMQLATSASDQPWCVTVGYAADNLHTIYWVSHPDRRHSHEVRTNPKVAGTIVQPWTPGGPRRGLSFEGIAREITNPTEIREHIQAYEERTHQAGLGEKIITGTDPRQLYELKPTLFALYDEANFPKEPRQEWKPTSS